MLAVIIVLIIFIFALISAASSKHGKDTPSDTYSDAYKLAESARRRALKREEEQKSQPIVKPVSHYITESKPQPVKSRRDSAFQVLTAPVPKEEDEKLKREAVLKTMKEASIDDADITFTEIIYLTDNGRAGELITYHSEDRKFYIHEFIRHTDDRKEYLNTKPCLPEEVFRALQKCDQNEEEVYTAQKRVAEICGELADQPEDGTVDVSDTIKRMKYIANRASFGFHSDNVRGRPERVLYCDVKGSGPFHEESFLGLDETEDAYIFSLFVTAPMAYTGGWEILTVNKHEIQNEYELNMLDAIIVDKWKKSSGR